MYPAVAIIVFVFVLAVVALLLVAAASPLLPLRHGRTRTVGALQHYTAPGRIGLDPLTQEALLHHQIMTRLHEIDEQSRGTT